MAKLRKEMASREGQNEIANAIREITRGVLDIERAEIAAGNAETSAEGAAASAQEANTVSTQLTVYLGTKETLTAPAIDPTLSISGAGADAKVTGDFVRELVDENIFNLLMPIPKTSSTGTIKCTWYPNGTCHVTGQVGDVGSGNIIYSNQNAFPYGMKAGGTYAIKHNSPSRKVFFEVYKWVGDDLTRIIGVTAVDGTSFTIPSDATGLYLRLWVYANTTPDPISETVKPLLYSVNSGALMGALCNLGDYTHLSEALGYTDANNVDRNCIIMCTDTQGHRVANTPPFTGWLVTFVDGIDTHLRYQIMFPYNNDTYEQQTRRFSASANTWSNWKTLSGGIKNMGTGADQFESCDDFPNDTIYFIQTSAASEPEIPDAPIAPCWIQTIGVGTLVSQIIYPYYNDDSIYYRTKTLNGWQPWKSINSGRTIYNAFNTNHYENTYNVTATPTITTDTNQYLAPTGDTTDVSASIEALLNLTGVCHLGPGDFYVSGVDVPEDCTLDGCGNATRIHLINSVADGYAVKLNTKSTLKDVCIVGADSDITLSETVGTRHGILWEGNADGANDSIPRYGTVSNVTIMRFSGGGITCNNSGGTTNSGMNVENCHIYNCNAGINVAYNSEFHRFTNVNSNRNYYGCINNGGNNVFTNCNFSTNQMGMLMDNSQGQSPNNSHGSAIGCVFNHTAGNTGIGIKILNCANGFSFTACQIFFSQIYLEDASGVIVADTVFGVNNCNITVVNGGAVLFNGNTFQGQPTVNITNNNHVKFVNCYVRSSGAVVPES